jgi:hypothetical protein
MTNDKGCVRRLQWWMRDWTSDQITIEQWLAIRKGGFQIDPETALVYWIYALTLDPYGVHPNLPEEWQQVGREYFACAPGSDIWVSFGDLSKATQETLWRKRWRAAGLEEEPDWDEPPF